MSLRQKLLSQSAVIFATRMLGAAIIFLAQAAIARAWGPEILGDYLLIIATMNIMAMSMPLGFHSVGTYFAAEYGARGDRHMLAGFLGRCYGHVLVVAALVYVSCAPIAGQFGGPGQIIARMSLPITLLAVATAIVFVNSSILVGLRRPFAGFLAETFFRPLLIIGAFGVAFAVAEGEAGLLTMLWLMACGYLVIALAQFGLVLGVLKSMPESAVKTAPETRRWWRFAVPWALISLATEFFFDLDILLLSGYLEREDLAIFGICTRFFALIAFGVSAVYAVTVPDIFEAEINKDRSAFQRRIGDANVAASLVAIGLVIAIAIGGPLALSIFGHSFVSGALPLVILALALPVRSIFGPASLVLSIHDRPYASLPAVAGGLGCLVVFNMVLVPPFGLMGAAIAALAAITIWSAGLWLTARVVAGVDVSIVARLRHVDRVSTQSPSKAGV